jgi:hypothetical protein
MGQRSSILLGSGNRTIVHGQLLYSLRKVFSQRYLYPDRWSQGVKMTVLKLMERMVDKETK